MPIIYRRGNILQSNTQVIVNTVNCKGVMGKGLALKFRKKYPEMFQEYEKECAAGKLVIGKLHLFKRDEFPWILNFPTKNDWRHKSSIRFIEAGLRAFAEEYRGWKIGSIAFPQLGCDLGGLKWSDVKPLMETYLQGLTDLTVVIYLHSKGKKTGHNNMQPKLTRYT
jgi:O-acetyl-ADP-ribose deacetylase (regulator of RNase III)